LFPLTFFVSSSQGREQINTIVSCNLKKKDWGGEKSLLFFFLFLLRGGRVRIFCKKNSAYEYIGLDCANRVFLSLRLKADGGVLKVYFPKLLFFIFLFF